MNSNLGRNNPRRVRLTFHQISLLCFWEQIFQSFSIIAFDWTRTLLQTNVYVRRYNVIHCKTNVLTTCLIQHVSSPAKTSDSANWKVEIVYVPLYCPVFPETWTPHSSRGKRTWSNMRSYSVVVQPCIRLFTHQLGMRLRVLKGISWLQCTTHATVSFYNSDQQCARETWRD